MTSRIIRYEIAILGLAVVTGLIVWLGVVPFVSVLMKQQQAQLSNNTRLTLPQMPVVNVKHTAIDDCSHNQTLDRGIICLPQDQKLLDKYHSERMHI
jgi:hypothetical protein